MLKIATTVMALGCAVPSVAQTQERTVDIGDIKAVAGLLLQAGYKAEIRKGKDGSSYISSAANGNQFSINFYGCKNDTACESLDFSSWYKKQPYFTPEMANEWNIKKRFLKVGIDGDGDLVEYVYVSAIGHTTFKNFADYVDWFTQMDGSLSKFLAEKEEAAKKAIGTK